MKIIRAYSAAKWEKPGEGQKRHGKKDASQGIAPSPLIKVLQTALDNSFILIQDSPLANLDTQSILTLIGPAGIYLFIQNDSRGHFRVEQKRWEQLDEGRRRFRPVQPNPLQAALEIAEQVKDALRQQSFTDAEVEPVIVFTNPGAYLETSQPALRLLPLDGLPRFAFTLSVTPPKLTDPEIEALTKLFAPQRVEEVLAAQEIRDDFSFKDEQTPRRKMPELNVPLPNDEKVVKAINKVPFSTRQMLILAVLVVLNILIILGLVLVILYLS